MLGGLFVKAPRPIYQLITIFFNNHLSLFFSVCGHKNTHAHDA